LRQCISIILHTSLGSDPLRPLFGSTVYKYVDAPMNLAIPNIKKSIIEALRIWETRIKVQSVNHRLVNESHVEFEITYLIVDENLLDTIVFNPNATSGSMNSTHILQANFPAGISIHRSTLEFILNNNTVSPAAPSGGFGSVDEMYAWVVTNWSNYGTWYLLSDGIICYLFPGTYTQTSLTCSILTSGTRYAADIPSFVIMVGYGTYNINFNPDGTGLLVSHDLGGLYLLAKDEILSFAVANWSAYGTWSIEYNGTAYQLVLNSTTLTTATLEVEQI